MQHPFPEWLSSCQKKVPFEQQRDKDGGDQIPSDTTIDHEMTERDLEQEAQEQHLLQTCFRVAARCCRECLFGPHKLVSDQRKAVILEACLHDDEFFRCHRGDVHGQTICCRGFFEVHGQDVLVLRLAHWLNEVSPGSIRFVEVEQDTKLEDAAK